MAEVCKKHQYFVMWPVVSYDGCQAQVVSDTSLAFAKPNKMQSVLYNE